MLRIENSMAVGKFFTQAKRLKFSFLVSNREFIDYHIISIISAKGYGIASQADSSIKASSGQRREAYKGFPCITGGGEGMFMSNMAPVSDRVPLGGRLPLCDSQTRLSTTSLCSGGKPILNLSSLFGSSFKLICFRSLAGVAILGRIQHTRGDTVSDALVLRLLGLILISVAISLLVRFLRPNRAVFNLETAADTRRQAVLLGAIIGFLVSLTSVGSGSLKFLALGVSLS